MRYIIILSLLFSTHLYAEVALDGSLGQQIELTGPNYLITESLGSRAGNNLFHSFANFNLSEGEIATFSGSDEIYNVISRVTGGSPSLIDGTIASDMYADFYFINPFGILFSKNSNLDLQGSFYAATANVLRFSDGNDFDTVNTENNLLSVSDPSAFGFLFEQSAPISVQQAELKTNNPFSTLAFIGNQPTFSNANIFADTGQIYIIGIAGVGEAEFQTNYNDDNGNITYNSEINLNTEKLADINMQFSNLDVSGTKGGNVYIRGGQVVLENSQISTDTTDYHGGEIDIQAQDLTLQGSILEANSFGIGNGGNINLNASERIELTKSEIKGDSLSTEIDAGDGGLIQFNARSILIKDGTQITSFAVGDGNAGQLLIKAQDLTITGGIESDSEFIPTTLDAVTESSGQGGNIIIETTNFNLLDGAQITADNYGTGDGGHININASERIELTGSEIKGSSLGIEIDTGDGGSIQFNARSILIKDGTQITSFTAGGGNGGQLVIKAQNLTITGGVESDGEFSPTKLDAVTESFGQGGNIIIETTDFNLLDGAQIGVSSLGTGNGGSVSIQTQNLNLSGTGQTGEGSFIAANSQSTDENAGRGGDITINAKNLTVSDGGQFTSSVFGTGHGGNISIEIAQQAAFSGTDELGYSCGILSMTDEDSTGNAGTIEFKATSLLLDNDGQINAETRGAGLGGDIIIETEDLIVQGNGLITAGSFDIGDAGNLLLDINNTAVLNQGKIETSTKTADGGNMTIGVGRYLFMRESELSTSVGAEVGNGGSIGLNSRFIILRDSPIVARAYGGNGGNINIVTRSIYKMQPDNLSPIDASSRFGLDGVITVSTPDVSSDEGLLILPTNFTRADNMLPKSCGAESSQSSFILQDRIGITPFESDWQPAHF